MDVPVDDFCGHRCTKPGCVMVVLRFAVALAAALGVINVVSWFLLRFLKGFDALMGEGIAAVFSDDEGEW